MNRQSNTYTIIYASVLVLVVGFVLAIIYQALRPAQLENIADDTRRQILSAALIPVEKGESVSDVYRQHVTRSFIVDYNGNNIDSDEDPMKIDISKQVKLPAEQRELPVFECNTPKGVKYILPVYGAGLWGPIWGYVAFDDNGDTIYGCYFSHQGETPGLGAEIEKPAFQKQFEGKNIFSPDESFQSVLVVKNGQEPSGKEAYVHAVSGGTITSHGVQEMLSNSLAPYKSFLLKLKNKTAE